MTCRYFYIASVLVMISFCFLSLLLLYLFLRWRKDSAQSVLPMDHAVTSATVTIRLEEERVSGVEHAPARYLHRYAKIRV